MTKTPEGICFRCREELPRASVPRWVYLSILLVAVCALAYPSRQKMLEVVKPPADDLLLAAESQAKTLRERVLPEPSNWERGVPMPNTTSTALTASVQRQASATAIVPDWFSQEQKKVNAEKPRVSITLYTTQWCSVCRAAKKWLNDHHQSYFERDIELDPEARVRVKTLNPKASVPTINVEGDVLVGFDPANLERSIDTAARRHLATPPSL